MQERWPRGDPRTRPTVEEALQVLISLGLLVRTRPEPMLEGSGRRGVEVDNGTPPPSASVGASWMRISKSSLGSSVGLHPRGSAADYRCRSSGQQKTDPLETKNGSLLPGSPRSPPQYSTSSLRRGRQAGFNSSGSSGGFEGCASSGSPPTQGTPPRVEPIDADRGDAPLRCRSRRRPRVQRRRWRYPARNRLAAEVSREPRTWNPGGGSPVSLGPGGAVGGGMVCGGESRWPIPRPGAESSRAPCSSHRRPHDSTRR